MHVRDRPCLIILNSLNIFGLFYVTECQAQSVKFKLFGLVFCVTFRHYCLDGEREKDIRTLF